jgi:hypothetical protein
MTPTTLYLLFWGLGAVAGGVVGLLVLRARGILTPAAAAMLLICWIGIMVGSEWQFRLESMPLGEALAFPLSEWRSGGRRIDLGRVLGILLGSGWCLAARVPWRPAADALAVAASALIPGGRELAAIFSGLFGRGQHLDIMFLDDAAEARLRGICRPFFPPMP